VDAPLVASPPTPPSMDVVIPGEAYYMVSQSHWEDDIIWNGDDVKEKILNDSKVRGLMAGWLPSSTSRTAEQFLQQGE
jgi:transcription initiation factor TFIID subunit 1